ncbi:MAG: HtrA protease/chaperone protein [uncultured Chloroflexi bacterium]|uniref:HtrA protease/chaperone protein n=1 Tax=uncultured Chloroflexota bacterium TaxID=166587 RepID=A0A6J4IMY1_9CHLR|nr:MAG: HtrA protease/chaperone protein [uncultured Chloroflexota bacterium]
MADRVGRTLRAFVAVLVSMLLGVALTLGYLTASTGGRVGRSLLPVSIEAPLSRDGEASKAHLFDEQRVMDVCERAGPAVVAIESRVGQRRGLGSGVIIDPEGIVLTNYHVIRNATQLDVALSDRTRYTGRVLGTDPQNDLAVVRLVDAPGGLPVVPLGELEDIKPGALAIAIGNPGGLQRSVTVGVVSGLNRTLRDTPARAPIREVIQTDAAINPGNSGGPLLNSRGELIGINTAIEVVNGQRGFGGIGFAVPVTTARRYLPRLLAGETIEHPWLGISGGDVSQQIARERGLTTRGGVYIEETTGDGPAAAAGVQRNDVIVSLGGHTITGMDDLGERLDRSFLPGQLVKMGIMRGRERLELTVTLGKWPERLPPTR